MRIGTVLRLAAAFLLCASVLTGCSGESASDYHKKGIKNMNAGDYAAAAENLKKASEKNPDKAEYYIDYGYALIQTGSLEDAQIQFDKALSDKKNQIVLENNKRSLRGKGIAYLYANQYEEAADAFDRASGIQELSDLNEDILKYLGEAQMKAADYEGAAETFTKILKNKKSDSASYGRRADAYAALGRTEDAKKDYDTAISQDGSNISFYLGKYNLLTAEGDENGAKDVLSLALAIKTTTDSDYFNLAVVHFLSGNLESAASEMSTALTKGFQEANYYLGKIYEQQKDYENALYYYQQYLDGTTRITSAAVYYGMSSCYLAKDDPDSALEMLEKGIALNDREFAKQLSYAQVAVYEKQGEFKLAKKAAKAYLELYPEDKLMKRELVFLGTRTAK